MRPQDLMNVSIRDNRPAKIQQERDESLKKLKTLWKTLYLDRMKNGYVFSNKEVKHLKDMLKEFDFPTLEKVMTYYIMNFDKLDYIQGYPSISALMGFRRRLVPEALNGKRKITRLGQAERDDDTKVETDRRWRDWDD